MKSLRWVLIAGCVGSFCTDQNGNYDWKASRDMREQRRLEDESRMNRLWQEQKERTDRELERRIDDQNRRIKSLEDRDFE